METSKSLAIESFSYSWLSNVKPSLDVSEEPLRASPDHCSHDAISKESDYKIVKSGRFVAEAQSFNFDIPISQSTAALLHADEIFSDGLIKPVFLIDPSETDAICTSDFSIISSDSSFPSRNLTPVHQNHHYFFKKWRKSSKKILQKCFGYLRFGCHTVRSSRKMNRVDDVDRRVRDVKSWNNSPQACPLQSTTYSVNYWCDIENSIYEAVLHCKRSIENDH